MSDPSASDRGERRWRSRSLRRPGQPRRDRDRGIAPRLRAGIVPGPMALRGAARFLREGLERLDANLDRALAQNRVRNISSSPTPPRRSTRRRRSRAPSRQSASIKKSKSTTSRSSKRCASEASRREESLLSEDSCQILDLPTPRAFVRPWGHRESFKGTFYHGVGSMSEAELARFQV